MKVIPAVETSLSQSHLQKLIDTGIPVSVAWFQTAVNNGNNIPEHSFSHASDNKERRVEMWATSADLLVYKQNGVIGFTPMANVRFGFFK